MLEWLTCHVLRAHDFAVRCDSGGVFLHCDHCGQRSTGWRTGPVDPLAAPPKTLSTLRPPLERVRLLLSELGLTNDVRRA